MHWRAVFSRLLFTMWPLQTMFQQCPCPNGKECTLPFCPFTHSTVASPSAATEVDILSQEELKHQNRRSQDDDQPAKRVKLEHKQEPLTPKANPFVGEPVGAKPAPRQQPTGGPSNAQQATTGHHGPVSADNKHETKKYVEDLPDWRPEHVGFHSPPFEQRKRLLDMLYDAMQRLNAQVGSDSDAEIKSFHLTEGALRRKAIGEEASAAKQPEIHRNIMGNRISNLQKFKMGKWVELLKIEKRQNDESQKNLVKTGLSTSQELAVLPCLLVKPGALARVRYVLTPPTPKECREAAAKQEASKNIEVCDRCNVQFENFPNRREDEALPVKGECLYHWGRSDKKGSHSKMTCCSAVSGDKGCTRHPSHVFRLKHNARKALLMQFEPVPHNASDKVHRAVCLDCEMGFTARGFELIRLTVLSWPTYELLIDVLVRPIGTMVDLNTRFSGIDPEKWRNASDYGAMDTTQSPTKLQKVQSPQAARALLFEFVSTDTILIGHALSNDLDVLRICHKRVVDSAMLFDSPDGCFRSLRHLARDELGRAIQQGGAKGHDSIEDSEAAGELVRCRVRTKEQFLKAHGWQWEGDELVPPANPTIDALRSRAGGKRKSSHMSLDGAADEFDHSSDTSDVSIETDDES